MKTTVAVLINCALLLTSTITFAQNWNEIAKGLPTQEGDHQLYGYSVSVDGDYAVIGAFGYESSKGIAYVLFYDGANWITQAQLTASDGAAGDEFGISVSISGDNIIIGAKG